MGAPDADVLQKQALAQMGNRLPNNYKWTIDTTLETETSGCVALFAAVLSRCS